MTRRYTFIDTDTGNTVYGMGEDEFEAAQAVIHGMRLGVLLERGPVYLSGTEHDYEFTLDAHFNQTAKPH